MVKKSQSVEILNREGVFLQKFCAQKIDKAGWKVEEEFPVAFEFSTGKKYESYESTGDIRATLSHKGTLPQEFDYELKAVIECKHRFKPTWTFFETYKGSSRSPKLLDLQYHPIANLSERASKELTAFYYADLNLKKLDSCLLCNIGKEIPKCIERKNKKYDSIYEACREVALATKSTAEEDRADFRIYGDWADTFHSPHTIYIPIVITSAKIRTCKYDLRGFAEDKVVKKASFDRVHWVAYDFPLPRYLRTTFQMDNPLDYSEMNKQPIFMVDFLKCADLLKLLEKYFAVWSDEILHDPSEYR